MIKRMKEKKQAELKKQKKHVFMKVCGAFALGSIISSVITLFTAPKSGKEMRQDVKDKVLDGADYLKENASKSIKKVGTSLENLVSSAPALKEKFTKKPTPQSEVPPLDLDDSEDELMYDEIKNFED